jgi:colanic acid/amylovoran biosynthesis glycosyltransferase
LTNIGYSVFLFVAEGDKEFSECEVVRSLRNPRQLWSRPFDIFRFLRQTLQRPKVIGRFIKLERDDGKTAWDILKSLYLNAHILAHKLDWIHFGFTTMALGKENVAKSIQAKMAVSFRGYDIGVYPIKHPGCYDHLWKKIDKVHTISNDLLRKAYELGLSEKVLFQKITPAIDINFFSPGSKKRNLDSKLNFLTVARLHWKKGIDYTLKALAILKVNGIDFEYSIVGDGSDTEYLIYLTHVLDLSDRVYFLGRLDPTSVKVQYQRADFYLQYSVQEGFCNAVLEAQAMGVLCFVSDAEGLQENVVATEK